MNIKKPINLQKWINEIDTIKTSSRKQNYMQKLEISVMIVFDPTLEKIIIIMKLKSCFIKLKETLL